ncbi:RNA polymerase II degradation factor 1 [Diospyros lotus]|uniref:RNA polymerase II degradation factor 1 n=1 Tax=Diospyros lotus TaxID=55363 RepID=UPI00225522F4|nr:RNA polymerase II degradation factor 1 [Diospyros lotus]
MATQRRDGSGAGKEKMRGTSPSPVVADSRPMTSKRSPIRPTTAAAAAAANHKHVSDHHQKRLPNYLKPTISSGIDHSNANANANATKQQPTTSTAQINNKANFNRRRSFEKPPSPSNHPANLHNKPVTQAHHHVNHSADQRNSRRSSPALRKATSMPRSHKAPNKDTGKSVFSSSRPTQKNTKPAGLNKKQTRAAAGAAAKAPAAVCGGPAETVEAPAVETHLQDDQDLEPVTNNTEEEVVKVDTVSELPAENPVLQEKESVVQDESEINDDEDFKPNCEPSADLEDVNNAALDVDDDQVEEAEDKVLAEETTGAINSPPKDEEQESVSQEEPKVVPKKENPEETGEDSTEETENPEGDEATEEKEEEASTAEGKQTTVVEKSGNETAAAAATVVQGGKKENQQAYNDVIEETASKLLEKRKNKVKALVGAFETVISLQEPEP